MTSRPADRVLAEAVRLLEHDGAAPIDDPAADAAARAAGGPLEHRIVVRAQRVGAAATLRDALASVRRTVGWGVAGLALLAALSGGGAARAALGAPQGEPVNFFWVVLALLGLQSVLLLAWAVLMAFGPRGGTPAPLGAAALALVRRAATGGHAERRAAQVAAVRALGLVEAGGGAARWTFSLVSHLLWTSFNAGCLVLLVLLLWLRYYTFGWETTLLSEDAYVTITRAVGALPGRVGFTVPTEAEIVASRWTGDGPLPDAARGAWSDLLIGAIIVYGLVPRLALVAVCAAMRRRAVRRGRLDLARPGFLRLEARLMPSATSAGVVDADDGAPAEAPPAVAVDARPADGPPAILGYEMTPPAAWPPRLHAVRWTDHGVVDGRADRERVLGALRTATPAPRATVVACDLTLTPDRGVRSFLESVRQAAGGRVVLVLTGGQALRDRSGAGAVVGRVDDWRRVARAAGVEDARVVELDLEHVTDASRAVLAGMVGAGTDDDAGGGRHLGAACALIRADVERWHAGGGAPGAEALTDLHHRIARLYDHDTTSWRRLFGVGEGLGANLSADLPARLRAGAGRFAGLLPDRLRGSARWGLAGALAGGLGCVAVGTLVAPAAFAALPAWLYGGGGLAAVLRFVQSSDGDGGHEPDGERDVAPGIADAVRAATLFALVLDMQGRGEAAITRVLDRALPADDELAPPADPASAVRWLDEVRHRTDLALAAQDGAA